MGPRRSKESGVDRWRGLFHYNLKNFAKAVIELGQAIELDPYYARAYYHRGRAHAALEHDSQAIDDFTYAITLDADQSMYRARGDLLRKLKRYEESLADLEKAIEIDSEDATSYDRCGLAHAAQGNYREAIEYYAKALAINPDEPWTRSHLITAYRSGRSQVGPSGL